MAAHASRAKGQPAGLLAERGHCPAELAMIKKLPCPCPRPSASAREIPVPGQVSRVA
jgi:hypothetical protein